MISVATALVVLIWKKLPSSSTPYKAFPRNAMPVTMPRVFPAVWMKPAPTRPQLCPVTSAAEPVDGLAR